LRDVYFADENLGWVLAERDALSVSTNDEARSYLLQTEDAGISWRQIFLNDATSNARLVRLMFADSQHGWICGESGVVFATRDGGAHWLRQLAPTSHLLLGGAFADTGHGWLVGAGATIVQTSDSGETWQNANLPRSATRFNAVSFADNRHGWAIGNSGQILRTFNGGQSWLGQSPNIQTDLLDVKFISLLEGWIAGNEGLVLHTRDGGVHWSAEATESTHALERLFILNPNNGWVVGFGGTILKYGPSQAPRLRS
jgi:photosystem II stability/assembly factor-like uncharacterized protein